MKLVHSAAFAVFLCCFAAGSLQAATAEELQAEARSAIQTLNKAIQEKNDPMRNRMYFKFRLIEQDHPGIVAPILIENLKSDIAGVPEYTAFILGWIEDPRAIAPLREMLKGNDEFKKAAAKALGNMKAKDAIPDLIALLSDTNPRIREQAAYGLGLIGDDSANEALQKLTQDPDELVQFFAKEALERIENLKKYGW